MIDLQVLYTRLCNGDSTALRDIYVNKPTLQQMAIDIINVYKRHGMNEQWNQILDL